MNFTIDEKDLEEIEQKQSELTGWLLRHFSNFETAAFVLQSIEDGVKDARRHLALTGRLKNGK